MQRHNAVVLGASGLVAQRMQQRLAHHPWFTLSAVVGSPRTAGTELASIPWNLEEKRPNLPPLVVLDAGDDNLVNQLKELGITVAFSCIPSEAADPLELKLSSAGVAVFSNASAFRRCDGVPLVIPDVNPEHMVQFDAHNHKLACATNCTLIPLAVPVAALADAFGVSAVRMNSEQALSGAGYSMVLDKRALAGRHPSEIPGEAEKTAIELIHVLGQTQQGRRAVGSESSSHREHAAFNEAGVHVVSAEVDVQVTCKRVTRVDGHQIFATVSLQEAASLEEVFTCFTSHGLSDALQTCPSAPSTSIQLVDAVDPEVHLWADGLGFPIDPNPSVDLKAGMGVVVGSIKMLDSMTVEFSALSHNTIRGAAGGTMFLAEQAYIEQRLPKQQ